MGDVHDRRSQATAGLDQLGAGLHPQLGVEVRERFVHQERLRPPDDRPGERHPLALTSRELRRLALEQVLEAEDARRLLHEAVPLGRRDAARLERELHVPPHRHVRVQRVALEDHGDVAVLRLDVVDLAAPDLDGAFGRLLEAGDHAQRGRLPAAGRPEQDEELLVGHLQGEVVDRGHVGEALRHLTDGDPAHGSPRLLCPC